MKIDILVSRRYSAARQAEVRCHSIFSQNWTEPVALITKLDCSNLPLEIPHRNLGTTLPLYFKYPQTCLNTTSNRTHRKTKEKRKEWKETKRIL